MPKNDFKVWALIAHAMGNSCPTHGLSMPTWWAANAHVTGTNRTIEGLTFPVTYPDYIDIITEHLHTAKNSINTEKNANETSMIH